MRIIDNLKNILKKSEKPKELVKREKYYEFDDCNTAEAEAESSDPWKGVNWNDKKEVLGAIKDYGGNLERASQELKNDVEIVIEAMKENENYLEYASEELKNNKKVMLEIVEAIKIKEEREKELKKLVKEVSNLNISRGNYNALTGNEIITADHSSGDKRWLTKDDVKKHGIPVKENEQSIVTIMTHKEEEKLYVKPVEYYNISQLEVTKEVEKQFKPMKEKVMEKSQEKGQGIGD